MMKKLYGTSMLKYEDTEEILEYYILNHGLNEKIFDVENSKLEMYGIEVVKKGKDFEEKSFVSDLTVDKKYAENILDAIIKNVVTPVHLYDVLENFVQ